MPWEAKSVRLEPHHFEVKFTHSTWQTAQGYSSASRDEVLGMLVHKLEAVFYGRGPKRLTKFLHFPYPKFLTTWEYLLIRQAWIKKAMDWWNNNLVIDQFLRLWLHRLRHSFPLSELRLGPLVDGTAYTLPYQNPWPPRTFGSCKWNT